MIKVLELFAGIGACSSALDRLGIEHEIVDAVEIDKYAMASFNAIHNTNFETQDIIAWDKDIKVDLVMHGSPCQDFSLAGKQAGGDIGSGTRSSLMYETIRIVGKLRPKYVIWENVKNVLSKKHRHNFENYLTSMESLGYTNYYQVLNAKDYGVPQNRERVFTVSILGCSKFEFPKGSQNENKIIELNSKVRHQQELIQDENGLCRCIPAGTHGSTPHLLKTLVRDFEFPPKQALKLRLKDILENEVDEKYYLSDKQIESIKASSFHTNARRIQEKDWCDTLCARDWKDPKCVQVGELDIKGHDCIKRVYSDEGLSPTLTDMQGGNRQPKIIIDDTQGFDGVRVYDKYSPALRASRSGLKTIDYDAKVAVAMRGRYDSDGKVEQHLEISDREIANSITTVQKDSLIAEPHLRIKEATKLGYKDAYEGDGVNISGRMKYQRGNVQKEMTQTIVTSGSERGVVVPDETSSLGLRIRKLTPRECFRLMGFTDEEFSKAEKVNSNTQLYKQAGNSIVVNVLVEIFKNLFEENYGVVNEKIYDYLVEEGELNE